MKNYTVIYLIASLLLIGCQGSSDSNNNSTNSAHEHHDHEDVVYLTDQQVKTMNFKIDSLPKRNLNSYVKANGQLEVPPQNEAEVTAIIGANIKSIHVIEGEEVKRGQVLAYISHPDIIQLQTDYIDKWNKMQFLKKEYERQEKLYAEKVNSGKEFEKIKTDYNAIKGNVIGLEAQLNLIGVSIKKLQQNEITQSVAIRSPLDGYVQMVEVKVGQYVTPSTPMFEIVNVEHVHADLMVFEKDVHKVKIGQKVKFTVQSMPDKELEAEIYAVGKTFEQEPKAVHLHAEIENKEGTLIPGMYVNGRILVEDNSTIAIPEEGLVREGNDHFIFSAKSYMHHGEKEWSFNPIKVFAGDRDNGWVAIKFEKELPKGTQICLNNAYQLLAEMKKEEAEHSH